MTKWEEILANFSQNIIVSGRDTEGGDLTNPTTYALLDAYYDMNLPQPILSVKLHKNTPAELYAELGRFFFTPGCLTPSLFNDDSLFNVLEKAGVDSADLPDYSIAGCQEPLIMGKDNGNTTNSWLNLGKILELTLTGGTSLVTGETIDPTLEQKNPLERLQTIREDFYKNVQIYSAHDHGCQWCHRSPFPSTCTFSQYHDVRTGQRLRYA